MKGDNDSWCTDLADVTLALNAVGLKYVDFDPGTNASSVVPCRIGYTGSDVCAPPLDVASVGLHPVSPGGKLLPRNGLEHPWPGQLTVYNNPPYSNPTPWVGQALVHALEGGRGILLLPTYGLDTAWAQALLSFLRLTQLDTRWSRAVADAFMLTLLDLADSRFNVPVVSERLRNWAHADAIAGVWSTLHCRLWMLRGRLAFIDPETREPAKNNRGGSMFVFYGFSNVSVDMRRGTLL